MLKWIEATGKNEEAAISAALEKLGMDRDEVSVEVLDRAKSGFLGLGSTPARVKISYEGPDEVEEAPPAPVVEKPQPVARVAKKETPAPAVKAVATDDDHAAKITAFLTGLMVQMNVEATPVISKESGEAYKVVLEGENLGMLIGRRGETLDAIQQLTNYSVNQGKVKRVRIHVDAENYRAKREESLQRLARKVADKVVKYRRTVTLEPMNAYERRIIHATLQENPNVTTYSTGTEPNRRTVVSFNKD